SGIYRHVWLKVFDPVHAAQWGTSVTTADVGVGSAKVRMRTQVDNQTGAAVTVTVTTRIVAAGGAEVGQVASQGLVNSNATAQFAQEGGVGNPALWSPESPVLYTAVSEISSSARIVDTVETRFGIRATSFDAAKGVVLNGKPMKLKGGCFHHDHGPLGSRSYDRAEERRIELMKASGFNAIRC